MEVTRMHIKLLVFTSFRSTIKHNPNPLLEKKESRVKEEIILSLKVSVKMIAKQKNLVEST